MAEVAKEHTPEWQELGVAVLHRLLIEDLLGGKDLPKPPLRPLGGGGGRWAENRRVSFGGLGHAGHGPHIHSISLERGRMPAKSTYFYPKLLSGLVINPLE